MITGFVARRSAAEIAGMIAEASGEEVNERTINRRRNEWQAEQDRRRAARERMEDLVAAMKSGNVAASEMIQALAMDKLQESPEGLTGGDPVAVQGLALRAEELRLKARQLDLRERQIKALEEKVRALQEREKRVQAEADALKDKAARGVKITAEEIERIHDIYGLKVKA